MWKFRDASAYMALCFILLSRRGVSFQSIHVAKSRSNNNNNHHHREGIVSMKYANADVETLKIRDIQAELQDRGVSYADCFDRESMVCRLQEARAGTAPSVVATSQSTSSETTTTVQKKKAVKVPDKEEIFADLRSKSIKDLKLECSRRNLRYATFLEKEDFVQAVWKDMQEVLGFSVSGAVRPGKASDISGEQLNQEITDSSTPILLDVYATWCGPCKLMAPEMDKVAAEFGKQVRVAKLDSDKYPQWAGKYKVAGLPTTLVIQNGEVKARMEGAIMKDRLMDLVQPYV